MSRYQEKKGEQYKSKYVEKPGPPKRFDFVYDPTIINFKTEIPPLPEKNRPKPDEKGFTKKITELRQKYEQLKEERKKKKNEYRAGSKNYEQEVADLKKKIELGKKCLVVLNFDAEEINNNITLLDQKIRKKVRLIKNLERGDKQITKVDKPYDQMNIYELENEEERLRIRVSTASLNKKEETELNALIAKINRLKRNATQGEAPKSHEYEVEENKDAIERLKKIKSGYENERDDIDRKIECIRDDIDDFENSIQEFEQKKRNPQIAALADEAKELKEEILKYRDEIAEIQGSFAKEKYEYEYEQEKIKWIKWAKEEQQKFQKKWEEQRAQKMKQKLRAKDSQPKKDGEDIQEKKIFNKYQKQIDGCTFLIDYCQNLKPKEEKSRKQQKQSAEVKASIESALQKGQWAKEKGVQIIKSKKAQGNSEKQDKPRKKKVAKKQQNDESQENSNFSHNVFIQNVFDSVKVIPPVNSEQLQKTINELQTKLDYFVEHPEGPVTRMQRTEKEKPKYTADKYAKVKQNKKVINTEDFPSLS